MIVLGINAYHGDASAAILVDGRLVAAAEEERFTRVKHAAGFPAHAVRYCLDAVGARLSDVDHVAVPRDPWARWHRKLLYAIRLPAFGANRARAAMRFSRIAEALAGACHADPGVLRARVHRVEHHRAHVASTFFVSPFDRSAVLSLDGLGDFGSGMWGIGEGNRIRILGGAAFPHSVGLYYTALTQYLGFPRYGDEYKVMGLAAYGEAEFLPAMRDVLRSEGTFDYRLALGYFTHHRTGPGMTWESGSPELAPLFSGALERRLGPARLPASPLERRHENVAASLQGRLEEVVLRLIGDLRVATTSADLAYAGGVAFNCVANGKALAQGLVKRMFVQPAAGDAGLAVGAAFQVWHEVLMGSRSFVMDHAYWGPEYAEAELCRAIERSGLRFRRLEAGELTVETAKCIAQGKIIGWFQGRMEWGPRALGSRSILADPRRPEMKGVLNRRIKHRESFRPFAPSVLAERTGGWFVDAQASPYMLIAQQVRPDRRASIPAVTHVDGTARVQTVERSANTRYWDLIRAFEELTGVPVLLNTSFNDDEPIVNTPEEALACFRTAGMDVLAMGPFLIDGGDGPVLREVMP